MNYIFLTIDNISYIYIYIYNGNNHNTYVEKSIFMFFFKVKLTDPELIAMLDDMNFAADSTVISFNETTNIV